MNNVGARTYLTSFENRGHTVGSRHCRGRAVDRPFFDQPGPAFEEQCRNADGYPTLVPLDQAKGTE